MTYEDVIFSQRTTDNRTDNRNEYRGASVSRYAGILSSVFPITRTSLPTRISLAASLQAQVVYGFDGVHIQTEREREREKYGRRNRRTEVVGSTVAAKLAADFMESSSRYAYVKTDTTQ